MSVVNAPSAAAVGFAPEEVDFSLSTRQARLKWVVVVNADLPPGRAANAAICAAAPTVAAVPGLLGADAADAEGTVHPGLPWAGCSVLVADSATLRTIRACAVSIVGPRNPVDKIVGKLPLMP